MWSVRGPRWGKGGTVPWDPKAVSLLPPGMGLVRRPQGPVVADALLIRTELRYLA